MTPPRARFGGIDIISTNMAASIEFYRAMGLDIADDSIYLTDGGPQHLDLHFEGDLGMDIDSDTLTAGYDAAWQVGQAGVVLMFRADSRDDVDAVHDHMVSLGHPSHLAPFDAFWGARYAIIVDPDGNHVSIMSPMDKAMGGPPPG